LRKYAFQLYLFAVFSICLPAFGLATPGSVDKNDCHHGGELKFFHCHGLKKYNKNSHTLIGTSIQSDAWFYGNGPMNLFIGGAVNFEKVHDFLAMYGGLNYLPHVSGDSSFFMTGWNLGIKYSKNLVMPGGHLYGHGGLFHQTFRKPVDDVVEPLFGLLAGAGYQWNFDTISIDGQFTLKSPSPAERMWAEFGAPGLKWHLSSKFAIYYRF